MKREKKPERLFRIVDKVLRQIFGETATDLIYKYLEQEHSLERENIPNELEIFSEGLKKFLGDSGALVVLDTLFNESHELRTRKVEEKDFMEKLKNLKRIQ